MRCHPTKIPVTTNVIGFGVSNSQSRAIGRVGEWVSAKEGLVVAINRGLALGKVKTFARQSS
jgi:hypothetical protein